jgi:hypothetical protein
VSKPTLEIPYKSVFSVPIILKKDGQPLEFDGVLLFMVKEQKQDPDSDAIIKKDLTILHTNGDPYHAMLTFDLDDTDNPIGKYWYGFKTGDAGVWLPTKDSRCEITNAIVQGKSL